MHRQKKGNSTGIINNKLMKIRAFFDYIVEFEVVKNSPAKKDKLLKKGVKI
ncbi:hypothetical protein PTI45_03793 [Paenibacillus nuruki]|uniref:Uncharacterized protein n=1 Tax=Paenibacillus nuruki TaxID=1886670 RepID=A0A1E3KZ82_9BACL|nr:hypothetical protein PTI45_03793 [Paenibacillus nuruki]